ncbi:LL-diaminopimelate aminotransferase [Acidaminococcus sp. NSJ-142]|jgi:LL-diaminopimelate aminotransferase|uniref:LL-diaminopimelate aminotransferase n=1 Tax=Acidaminococcus TaxID=904 RepID=UPI000CF8406E|nr:MULTISPECIES: LL-diaminopimelate aminotransferase [Acidaminococcus]MCD2436419.1 LL-diaminopimelate aminotransferase [Acidaminococcus hominis]MCH4097114.1 LL-diaminopimelate aminotransferase [Acidaminococcus provencensis]RHJ99960.1 LL-diaminopimelate aminotransferase [Acidaminococcus sp. AM05-11]
MALVNGNYAKLKDSYLFSDIAARVAAFTKAHPEKKLIKMGIGDVTLPLAPVVVDAMTKAVQEMGKKETFRGYGPEQGYDFLHEAIVAYYARHGVELDSKEIFISDGAKSDCGNMTDLFDDSNVILVPDPVYPVYVDTNLMRGRKILYMNGTPENGFLPMPDFDVKADIVYLCSPNNPTGAVYTRDQLAVWVEYAKKYDAILLYDAAYEAFITDENIPRSIYEVPGAKDYAIEICSFSKTAGFTGTRCGYTVVPLGLKRKSPEGKEMSLNKMWLRRQTTKFNGVNYIVQRGAEAAMSPEGEKECGEMLAYYRENARMIMETFDKKGYKYFGGKYSPYVWMQCPNHMGSWEYFDHLLNDLAIVGTPGAGFGTMGEGYLRLSAFGTHEGTKEAMERIEKDSI